MITADSVAITRVCWLVGWLVVGCFVRSLVTLVVISRKSKCDIFMKFGGDVQRHKSKKSLTYQRSGSMFKVKNHRIENLQIEISPLNFVELNLAL